MRKFLTPDEINHKIYPDIKNVDQLSYFVKLSILDNMIKQSTYNHRSCSVWGRCYPSQCFVKEFNSWKLCPQVSFEDVKKTFEERKAEYKMKYENGGQLELFDI